MSEKRELHLKSEKPKERKLRLKSVKPETGYFNSNSVQGMRVRIGSTIFPGGIIRVSVNCPKHGHLTLEFEGTGRTRAEELKDETAQQHQYCTRTDID